MIYNSLKRLILAGRYEQEDMQHKLDTYLAYGRLTHEQYEELVGLMA